MPEMAETRGAFVDLSGALMTDGAAIEGLGAWARSDAAGDIDSSDRRAVIATWQGRMHNEYVSGAVFDALADQLERLQSPGWQHAVSTLRGFADDEHRHGRLCAAVVEALGGHARVPRASQPPYPQHEDVAPLEGFVRNLLSVSCLAETVAVSLIAAERAEAGPAPLADVLGRILSDEVQHARFGWKLMGQLAPRWQQDDALRARLGAWLRVAFAHLEAHELEHLPATASTPERTALGACDGRAARALFYETVETVIVPQLDALGLDASTAWETRLGPDA